MTTTTKQAISKADLLAKVEKLKRLAEYIDIRGPEIQADMERLCDAIESNDVEQTQEVWAETIDGCDPWSIGSVREFLEALDDAMWNVDIDSYGQDPVVSYSQGRAVNSDSTA